MNSRKIFLFGCVALSVLAGCKKGNEPVDPVGPVKPETTTVADACNNVYNVIKIGDLFWMTENLRCNKYDTQSEKAGTVLAECTSQAQNTTPFYFDASDKTKWTNPADRAKITDDVANRFGYYYNWLAASGAEYADEAFTGVRQGICPNGYHLPTVAEYDKLLSAVGGADGSAAKLKSKTGWLDGKSGTDDFGFSAFPSGRIFNFDTDSYGTQFTMWTATHESGSKNPTVLYMHYTSNSLMFVGQIYYQGSSVRCVKN